MLTWDCFANDRARTHRTRKRRLFMKRNVSPTPRRDFRGRYRLRMTACTVESSEAPSGMLARGHYEAVSKFADDDGHDYLKFDWSFDIAKDWK